MHFCTKKIDDCNCFAKTKGCLWNKNAILGSLKFVQPSREAQTTSHAVNRATVTALDGSRVPFDHNHMLDSIAWASAGHTDTVNQDLIAQEAIKNIFDGITTAGIADALVLGTVGLIERDPAYGYVAARLLFKKLYREVAHVSTLHSDVDHTYTRSFVHAINMGLPQIVRPTHGYF